MATKAAVYAHAGFALGYAEHGTFPIGRRAQAACVAIQETASEFDSPQLATLVIEAGRSVGRRTSREGKHRALYDYHSSLLGELLAPILARIDTETLAPKLAALAVAHATDDPVARRKVVSAAALAAIMAQVTAEDREALDKLNQDGWSHATAYGTGEADATPKTGGAPHPDLVAGAVTMALSQASSANAELGALGWTDLELQTVAMGAALSAGNGADLAAATRAVTTSLVDSGRATITYANQLHQAVGQAYVSAVTAKDAEAEFDWVNADNPCEECEDNEMNGPYKQVDIPEYPAHTNCMCDLELAEQSVAVGASA